MVHSSALLIPYYDSAEFLLECLTTGPGDDVDGSQQVLSFFGSLPSDLTGYTCLAAENTHFALYAKHLSGNIDRFARTSNSDNWSWKGLVIPSTPLHGLGCENFLVTDDGNALIVQRAAPLSDIVKVNVQTDPPTVTTLISNANGIVSNARVMRWAPNGDLCVLVDFGLGDALPKAQGILRFDGNSGDYKGELIPHSAGQTASPQNIVFCADFEFGPDHNLYAIVEDGSLSIRRFDGNSGQFIDTFRTAAQLPDGAETLQLAPDKKLLFLMAETSASVFDSAGNTKHIFPLQFPNPGRCTFIEHERIKARIPHDAFLTEILVGLRAGDSGWVIGPGGHLIRDPGGVPWIRDVWTSLTSPEQEVLIGYAIERLSAMLPNRSAAAGIQSAMRGALGPELSERLDMFIQTRSGEGTR